MAEISINNPPLDKPSLFLAIFGFAVAVVCLMVPVAFLLQHPYIRFWCLCLAVFLIVFSMVEYLFHHFGKNIGKNRSYRHFITCLLCVFAGIPLHAAYPNKLGSCYSTIKPDELSRKLFLYADRYKYTKTNIPQVTIYVKQDDIVKCPYANDLFTSFRLANWNTKTVTNADLRGQGVWFHFSPDDRIAPAVYFDLTENEVIRYDATGVKDHWDFWVNDTLPTSVEILISKQ